MQVIQIESGFLQSAKLRSHPKFEDMDKSQHSGIASYIYIVRREGGRLES